MLINTTHISRDKHAHLLSKPPTLIRSLASNMVHRSTTTHLQGLKRLGTTTATLWAMKMLNFIFHRDRAVYTRLETMPELEKRLVRKLGTCSCIVMVVHKLIGD
jgi:hypothetical protein